MTAPVQVLVIGLDRLEFDGSVLAELDRLRDAGTVRLLDVLLVTRAADGAFSTLPPPAALPPGTGAVVAQLLGAAEEQPAALVVDTSEVGASEESAGAPPQGPDAVPRVRRSAHRGRCREPGPRRVRWRRRCARWPRADATRAPA